jgi:hypothetical protein
MPGADGVDDMPVFQPEIEVKQMESKINWLMPEPKFLIATPEDERQYIDPSLEALQAASAFLDVAPGSTNYNETFGARMLKQELCTRFEIKAKELEIALHHLKTGMAIPSEAFVAARDAAQRLAGRLLSVPELQKLVNTIKEQEQQNDQS